MPGHKADLLRNVNLRSGIAVELFSIEHGTVTRPPTVQCERGQPPHRGQPDAGGRRRLPPLLPAAPRLHAAPAIAGVRPGSAPRRQVR